MADSTIANLTDGTTADATDRIPVERSPFGAGTNRYVTPNYIATYILGGSYSANLTYSEASGPRLQVGTTGTNQGWILGQKSNNISGIWSSALTPTTANYSFAVDNGGNTEVNAPSNKSVILGINGSAKVTLGFVAGQGLSITPGTATTNVVAGLFTQTRNAAGVTFDGALKVVITDTASAAGSLAMQILGGASGTTNLFSVTKSGTVDINGSFGVASGGAINGSGGSSITGTGNYRMQGKGYILPQSDGVWCFADEATTSFGRLQFGGTTSSFPALKRSSATLQARLADDSAYAGLAASQFDAPEVTAPSGVANTARIFAQDNGAGKTQLMVIFGSGAAQQIAIEA